MTRRANTAATARRIDAERARRDMNLPVAEFATDELWAVVYRLQQRRTDACRARIREVEAERVARREAAS